MNYGYYRIPRSLDFEDSWIDLPIKTKFLFYTLVNRACFKETTFDDRGITIHLKPGELCASIREIQKWCGKDFSKNDVERGVSKLFKVHFLRQEVRHIKTVITITHRETYDLIINGSETHNETNLRQKRDKIETQKNNVKKDKNEKTEEKTNKKESPELPLATSLLTEFYQSLLKFKPNYPKHKCKSTTSQINAMLRLLKHYGEIKIRQVIAFAHESNFWIAHVHTPVSLEKKFETLEHQMLNSSTSKTQGYSSNDRRTRNADGTPVVHPLEGLI